MYRYHMWYCMPRLPSRARCHCRGMGVCAGPTESPRQTPSRRSLVFMFYVSTWTWQTIWKLPDKHTGYKRDSTSRRTSRYAIPSNSMPAPCVLTRHPPSPPALSAVCFLRRIIIDRLAYQAGTTTDGQRKMMYDRLSLYRYGIRFVCVSLEAETVYDDEGPPEDRRLGR
ncbi:hypothetical protein BC628DRAFT_62864 [Trametes gibbosa]|nr:hypothetical protein BC628DRAFT_62864 [Trametes gibbosa]